jgi:hypothetical protein
MKKTTKKLSLQNVARAVTVVIAMPRWRRWCCNGGGAMTTMIM